jgi:hypothetical protein
MFPGVIGETALTLWLLVFGVNVQRWNELALPTSKVGAGHSVQFEGDKMAQEHLYWDQASVLVQLGLLEPGRLPVVGAEGARSVLDRSIRLNELIRRSRR